MLLLLIKKKITERGQIKIKLSAEKKCGRYAKRGNQVEPGGGKAIGLALSLSD